MRRGGRVPARVALARVTVLALMVSTLAFGSPTASLGGVSPTIEFLNPSSFGINASDTIIVSDRAATRPRTTPEEYRISAWIKGAPQDAGVEFELLSNGVSLDTLDTVTQVGVDTFDYNWDIPPTLPDGPYTLRATLFANNEAIDHVDADITILRVADRASVDYPVPGAGAAGWPGGASFGTYRPLANALPEEGRAKRGKPVGNIEASHTKGTDVTSGTTWVRAFYTTSEPGTPPKWTACGTEKTPSHPVPSSAANDGIRCTLGDAAQQTQVSAVAVLANNSPGNWDAAAVQSGDAVRVLESYAQHPAAFSITSGDGEILEQNTNGGYPCHTIVTHLADQRGREISGANIDAHLTGPSDKLRLDVGLATESGIKEADRNHFLTEPGHDCFGDDEQAAGLQSEHQILGGPDMKHGEADDYGTDDNGNWGFSFKVPADQTSSDRYSVNVVAFVDEGDDGCHANDDLATSAELLQTASVGLDKAPVPTTAPVRPDIQRCDRLRALRSITLNVDRSTVARGKTVDFNGAVQGPEVCVSKEKVKLRRRRDADRHFKTIDGTTTNAVGSYSFPNVRVDRTFQYRTVVLKTEQCIRARSNIETVKVKTTG